MLKQVTFALVIGLGSGWALADDGKGYDKDNKDVPQSTDKEKDKDNRGVIEKSKDKLFGGTKKEKLDVGTLKLSIEDVQKIKQLLISRGYAFKNATGKWDDESDKAIEKFQLDTGVKKSGKLDVATLNAMGFGAIVAVHPDVKGSEDVNASIGGTTGVTERPAGLPQDAAVIGGGKEVLGFLLLGKDQIKGLQERLAEEGFFKGDKNGAFTKELVDALKRFQEAKGIKPTAGVVDIATLAWFPEANIDVEVTDQPESEISEPVKGLEGTPRK